MNTKKAQIIIGIIVVVLVGMAIIWSQGRGQRDEIDATPVLDQTSTSTEKSVSAFIQTKSVTTADKTVDLTKNAAVISGIQTQNMGPANVIVSWTTSIPAKTEISFSTVPPAQNVVVQMTRDAKLKTVHAVELTSLAPNTTYYYTIVSSGKETATTTVQGLFKTTK